MNTVLFDFGGTLDTNGIHWFEKFRSAFEAAIPDISYEIIREAYLFEEKEILKFASTANDYYELIEKQFRCMIDFLNSKGVKTDGTDIQKQIDNVIYDVQENIEISLAIMKIISKDFKIAIISNFYGNLKEICGKLGFNDYVNIYIDSAVEKISKPDPAIFQLALKRLKRLSEETYVVGDSYERDIVPAKQIGCTTIWLKGKSWKEEDDISSCDFIINDINKILKIIQNG
jgi:putative hydrolase of the HAD superfamily